MAESQDAERPPKNVPKYLPRTWKAQPEPEPDAPANKKKKSTGEGDDSSARGREGSKKSGKRPKVGKGKDDGGSGPSKGALVEETPTLDTYQARQTARIITGVAIAGLGFLVVCVVFWMASGTKDEETAQDEALLAQLPSQDPARAEREARFMFNRAREVVKRGNVKLTVAFLEKINRSYPRTVAAQEAATALSKPANELAEFLEKSSGLPTGPSTPKVVTGPSPPPATSKVAPAAPPAQATQPASPNPHVAAAPGQPSPAPGVAPPGNGPVPPGGGPAPPLASGPAPPVPASGAASMPSAPTAVAANATTDPLAKALPASFHRVPGAGVSSAGWPLQIVCDRDGATMVLVPGGNYRMGRDDGELSEGPGHRVVLGTYYVDQHEVTVRQFDVFQKQDGVRSERSRALQKIQSNTDDSDDAPVTMVNAREAKDYATWAGKQLPTEAQWEIAARWGMGVFSWGNDDAQWDKPREFRKVQPVRSHPRDVSPCGAFDMAGNAWEWTKDWYDVKYYSQFRNSVAENPTGPAKPKSEQLTVRGCSKNWSITKREGFKWNTRLPYLGFRCVLQVEGPGNAFEAPAGTGGPATPGRSGNSGAVVPF